MLIIGPHAGVLSQTLEPGRALAVILGGFTIQGVGFLVSMMIYPAFMYRLMTQKLPQEATRPGMFVSVGPAGFTVAGIIGMATGASRALPLSYMGDGHLVAMILKVVASWMGLWIWGLAFWFFFISVGALVLRRPRQDELRSELVLVCFPKHGFDNSNFCDR